MCAVRRKIGGDREAMHFAPRGGKTELRAVMAVLRRFGSLSDRDSLLAQREIVKIATHFNRLNSDDYQGPTRSKVLEELDTVRAAADRLSTSLDQLHYVSLCWLLGSADPIPPFRYLANIGRDTSGSHPWEGPWSLHNIPEYPAALAKAFAPQMPAYNQDAESRSKNIRELQTKEAAEDASAKFITNLSPDRRKIFTAPLALQMRELAKVASLARKGFETNCRKPGGGPASKPFAVEPPMDALALECFILITAFHPRPCLSLIGGTKDGLFHTLVKVMAHYATGKMPENSEFEASAKKAVKRGKEIVKQWDAKGRDFFGPAPAQSTG